LPTVRREGSYRFFFYSTERNEPAHIHVEANGHAAKFWLAPVRLAESHGFAAHEERELLDIVQQHREEFSWAWEAHFRDG
jgi:hypothetical protein